MSKSIYINRMCKRDIGLYLSKIKESSNSCKECIFKSDIFDNNVNINCDECNTHITLNFYRKEIERLENLLNSEDV